MRTRTLGLIAGLLWCGLAVADTRETMARNYALFERYASAPIEEIRQFRLDRYQALGESAIGLWSNPGELYLVDLDGPCNGLDFARSIGVSSTHRSVSRRFDYVTYGSSRCQITKIRPVDEKAMRKDPEYGHASDRKR